MPAQMQVSSKLASGDSDCDLYSNPVNTWSITVTESKPLRAEFITDSLDFTWEQHEIDRRKLDLISCSSLGWVLCKQASIANGQAEITMWDLTWQTSIWAITVLLTEQFWSFGAES